MTGSPFNPARIDYVSLKLLCAVAQRGSLTKAASNCNLAVSAASRRIGDLEATAGVQLFERSAAGLTLTPAGHVALQHARRLLQGFEQFGREIEDYSEGRRGQVRLWANMSALSAFLPDTLHKFIAEHDGVRLQVEEHVSGDVVRGLADGLADVGIFSSSSPSEGISSHPYLTDDLLIVCSQAHPLSDRASVEFRECLEHDIVGLSRGTSLVDLMASVSERSGIPLKLRAEVASYDVMCSLVNARLGIGMVPTAWWRLHQQHLDLCALELRDEWAHRTMLIGMSQQAAGSSCAQLLVNYIRSTEASPAHPVGTC